MPFAKPCQMGGTVKARNRCALKSSGPDFARYNGSASPDRAQGVRAREDTKEEAMDPKRKKRPPAKVVKRIAEMKADRRRDLFKGALGLGAALLLVAAKTALEALGPCFRRKRGVRQPFAADGHGAGRRHGHGQHRLCEEGEGDQGSSARNKGFQKATSKSLASCEGWEAEGSSGSLAAPSFWNKRWMLCASLMAERELLECA